MHLSHSRNLRYILYPTTPPPSPGLRCDRDSLSEQRGCYKTCINSSGETGAPDQSTCVRQRQQNRRRYFLPEEKGRKAWRHLFHKLFHRSSTAWGRSLKSSACTVTTFTALSLCLVHSKPCRPLTISESMPDRPPTLTCGSTDPGSIRLPVSAEGLNTTGWRSRTWLRVESEARTPASAGSPCLPKKIWWNSWGLRTLTQHSLRWQYTEPQTVVSLLARSTSMWLTTSPSTTRAKPAGRTQSGIISRSTTASWKCPEMTPIQVRTCSNVFLCNCLSFKLDN